MGKAKKKKKKNQTTWKINRNCHIWKMSIQHNKNTQLEQNSVGLSKYIWFSNYTLNLFLYLVYFHLILSFQYFTSFYFNLSFLFCFVFCLFVFCFVCSFVFRFFVFIFVFIIFIFCLFLFISFIRVLFCFILFFIIILYFILNIYGLVFPSFISRFFLYDLHLFPSSCLDFVNHFFIFLIMIFFTHFLM